MERFHVKSIILGIGIGFFLMSLLGMVYSAGSGPEKLSEEEIIRQAEGLGMVKGDIFVKPNQDTLNPPKSSAEPEKSKEPNEKSGLKTDTGHSTGITPASTPSAEEGISAEKPTAASEQSGNIEIQILPGETEIQVADKLFEANVISDKKGFIKIMVGTGADKKIIAKKVTLKKGMELHEVIDRIISK